VKLDTSATPLVVLDNNANSASTLIVIGSKYVNTVAQQIFAQNPSLDSSFGTSSVVLQAFGSNRILVAGYYANQTVQAGNQFIQALLSAA
jgi:maleate cis-trans isomerase